MELAVKSVTAYDLAMNVYVDAPSGNVANISLNATSAAKQADVSCNVSAGQVSTVMLIIDGVVQATATTTGLKVTGIAGNIWKFHNVVGGGRLRQIDGYTSK